jgi:hypothetical protein
LFEDFENTDVRNAAGETTAQRNPNGWNFGRQDGRQNRSGLAGEFPPEGLY